MKYQDLLQSVLLNDPIRMNALYAVQALELSDGWIAPALSEMRSGIICTATGKGQFRVTWMLSGSTRKAAAPPTIGRWKRG